MDNNLKTQQIEFKNVDDSMENKEEINVDKHHETKTKIYPTLNNGQVYASHSENGDELKETKFKKTDKMVHGTHSSENRDNVHSIDSEHPDEVHDGMDSSENLDEVHDGMNSAENLDEVHEIKKFQIGINNGSKPEVL